MRFTLVADGASDRALLPMLTWLLREVGVTSELSGQWADYRRLRTPPVGLKEKIAKSIELYPCDLLFIHCDAEVQDPENRRTEINQALQELHANGQHYVPHICVVPVRMQEAWLLIDLSAIRSAAGNPNGNVALTLPRLPDIEAIPDPKQLLFQLLRQATQLSARRLRKFSVLNARQRVSELIEDYGPLRRLPAFLRLEEDLRASVPQNRLA